jgi:hypothetical protein
MAERDPSHNLLRNYPAYEEDFAAWVEAQAAALKDGRFGDLDIANLVDEVEGVGKSEFRSFFHALEVLIFHMMKWDYQPERQGRSWRNTINEQRRQVLELLAENPSFKSRIDEAVDRAYGPVPYMIEEKTTIPAERLPKACPYSWDEIMTRLHDLDPDRLWPN